MLGGYLRIKAHAACKENVTEKRVYYQKENFYRSECILGLKSFFLIKNKILKHNNN